jgi:hypothetical protein
MFLSHARSHASQHLVKDFGKNGAVRWTLGADDHSLSDRAGGAGGEPELFRELRAEARSSDRAGFPDSWSAGSLVLMSICPQIAFTISDGPRIGSVKRFGYRMMPTTIVLTFDQALDAITAEDAKDYRIIGPAGRTIAIKKAV